VPQAIRTAHSVVTVTERVKAELMKEYSLSAEQVIVVPLVPRLSAQPDMNIIDKLQLELGAYILFVGAIEPRKNLVNLVAAYELLPSEVRDKYPLVLVGPLSWKNEELLAKLDDAKAKGANIIMPGYVTEPEKAALFANAATFVLPAVYEGFGIPPMEAMSVGTPVVASDLPVTHEVLGDAGYYMDQNDPQSIANAITKVVDDPALRKSLSERSLARMADLNKSFEAGCDELARRMKEDT
jgi:glycosyltransferase involved in cell wall biosynthesis